MGGCACAQLADIWSCGIILYAMLFGRYPFNARERDYARKIVAAQYVMPSDVAVSADCADLLTRLLVADPGARLPMEAIKRHPWFLQELPPGALDMNEYYLKAPPVLDMARVPSSFLFWHGTGLCVHDEVAGHGEA
jgi:serine/threonine-protein kinase SRK2